MLALTSTFVKTQVLNINECFKDVCFLLGCLFTLLLQESSFPWDLESKKDNIFSFFSPPARPPTSTLPCSFFLPSFLF